MVRMLLYVYSPCCLANKTDDFLLLLTLKQNVITYSIIQDRGSLVGLSAALQPGVSVLVKERCCSAHLTEGSLIRHLPLSRDQSLSLFPATHHLLAARHLLSWLEL